MKKFSFFGKSYRLNTKKCKSFLLDVAGKLVGISALALIFMCAVMSFLAPVVR